jgi:hypothetical protein
MIRISEISRSGTVVRFRVEGRLTAHTAAEVAAAADRCLGQGLVVMLELGAVRFADAGGIDRLEALHERGAVLVGCSPLIAEMRRRRPRRFALDDPDRALVRRGVDELPDGLRTVLLLHDVEGLGAERIAALLGIAAGAVKLRLHRARQALPELISAARAAGGSQAGAGNARAAAASNAGRK